MSGFLVHWLVVAMALLVTTRLVGGVQAPGHWADTFADTFVGRPGVSA